MENVELKIPDIVSSSPYSTRKYDTAKVIEKRTDIIKDFCGGTLANRFYLPVEIDDTTARAIAYSVVTKGCDSQIWLNERPVNVRNLRLKISLEYPPEAIT